MKQTLSPKELGEAVGVSESSLKRWADGGLIRVVRTAGGHRRIAVPEALRFIRERGLPVRNPQALGVADLAVASAQPRTEPADALQAALLDGRASAVRGLVLSWYLGGQSVAAVCDGPMAAAMHRIGALWRHDPAGIFLEHRATDLCLQAIHHLRGLLPEPADDAPVAVGGAPPGDPYLVPSLMAATALTAEGWRAMNLGPETPLHVLAAAAAGMRARLAWLSLSVAGLPEAAATEVTSLAQRLGAQGARLVVGGRGVGRPLATGGVPHLHVAGSIAELVAFAGGLATPR